MKNEIVQKWAPFLLLLVVAIIALFVPQLPSYVGDATTYSPADIAWILVATALVFIMTPGLAFFYGGISCLGWVRSPSYEGGSNKGKGANPWLGQLQESWIRQP